MESFRLLSPNACARRTRIEDPAATSAKLAETAGQRAGRFVNFPDPLVKSLLRLFAHRAMIGSGNSILFRQQCAHVQSFTLNIRSPNSNASTFIILHVACKYPAIFFIFCCGPAAIALTFVLPFPFYGKAASAIPIVER
jgi:hypothetical protein